MKVYIVASVGLEEMDIMGVFSVLAQAKEFGKSENYNTIFEAIVDVPTMLDNYHHYHALATKWFLDYKTKEWIESRR